MNIKSFLSAVISAAGILTLAQPASAFIYDWRFTNEDGTSGSTTDIISGIVEFNDADVFPGATDVDPINFQVNNIPGFPNGISPIIPNENLLDFPRDGIAALSFPGKNPPDVGDFDFDSNLMLGDFSLLFVIRDDSFRTGLVNFTSSASQLDVGGLSFRDNDSSSVIFQEASASVPFEFSPTLGLVLAGSFFAGSRVLKRRSNNFVK